MRLIRICLLAIVVGGNPYPVLSQVVKAVPVTKDESFFLYEVKLIDEFIERFNDDPSSYIRQQCISLYGTDSIITRPRMVKSLFNKQGWCADAEPFIKEVTGAKPSHLLSFTDSSWYAEASCVFTINNKKTEVPLILHIKTERGASKWMIAGIGKADLSAIKAGPVSDGSTSGNFVPTSSHGTNFVVFQQVFSKGMKPADYFEQAALAMPRAQQLISAVKQGNARFQYVKNIRYHFFNVDNWVFTVDQFKRKDANSGWLISSLKRVNPKEKEAALTNLLYP